MTTARAAAPSVETDVVMTTADGVRLVSDVYRPTSTPGPWPTLVVRTPYGRRMPTRVEGGYFAAHGYLVVIQDVRGRGDSGGTFAPFVDEARDGAETIAWAAGLPGSTGEVAMVGQSYLGSAQIHAAATRPPALRAASPVSAPTRLFDFGLYRNGTPEHSWLVNWALMMARAPLAARGDEAGVAELLSWSTDPAARVAPLTAAAVDHTPVVDWGARLRAGADWLAPMLEHPAYDDFWRGLEPPGGPADITVPMLHVTSWYDAFVEDTLTTYQRLRAGAGTAAARDGQRLVVGPWAHLFSYAENGSGGAGEADFGPHAALDLLDVQRRWLDAQLAGVEAPGPRVRLFVLGVNEWRDEEEWPPARRVETPLYLHGAAGGDGTLAFDPPTARPGEEAARSTYVSDPAAPVPARGGASLHLPSGVFDQAEISARPDVVTFTGEPLAAPLEVTGHVEAVLYAATSAPDTDWVVRLVDVHPDGYEWNVVDGVLSARFRESRTHPTPVTPGEVHGYRVDLWSTSYVFRAGHRLRVQVTSAAHPRWARNPQTGEPPLAAEVFAAADQTVLHDAVHASHLVLPVIPTAADPHREEPS